MRMATSFSRWKAALKATRSAHFSLPSGTIGCARAVCISISSLYVVRFIAIRLDQFKLHRTTTSTSTDRTAVSHTVVFSTAHGDNERLNATSLAQSECIGVCDRLVSLHSIKQERRLRAGSDEPPLTIVTRQLEKRQRAHCSHGGPCDSLRPQRRCSHPKGQVSKRVRLMLECRCMPDADIRDRCETRYRARLSPATWERSVRILERCSRCVSRPGRNGRNVTGSTESVDSI